jgi:hypothetical protein
MNVNRKIALLAIVLTATVGSALVTNVIFTAVANTGSVGAATNQGACFDKSWSMLNHTKGMPVPGHPGNWSRPPRPGNWSGNVTVTVTAEQAKTTVSNALKEFTVGNVTSRGSVWVVSIKYKDKTVTDVPLGKLNTSTSQDAVKAVQDSMGKGWNTGEAKQHGFIYNVPLIDANGNTLSNVRVDGRTGNIAAGFPSLRR